jgi:cytochrome c biogenesis protein CcdA
MSPPLLPLIQTGQRGPERTPQRAAVAVVAVLTTLALVVALAVVTPDGAGGLNLAVERLSSRSSGLLGEVGTLLPFGFAFAAGMVSSVNPCGFPLLPAYVGIFLGDPGLAPAAPLVRRLARALRIGTLVTVGFVVLFAVFGLLLSLGARLILAWLPWVAASLGAILVAVGGYRFAGGSLHFSLPARVAARVRPGSAGTPFYVGFGLAYGLASLSCTLPIFLAVVGTSVTAKTVWTSLGSLVMYGLGMGFVVVTLTLAAGVFQAALDRRLRRLLPFIGGIGTIALFAAGGYVVYYWLTVGGLLHSLALLG